MALKHKTGTDQSVGGFLREPGTYHFCILDTTENPTNKDGQLIDNAAFRIVCDTLAGTAPGQEQKQCEITFFWPKPADKNEGAFNRKKIDRFLLAVGLMKEEDKDKEIEFDIQKAVGRQFIAKMELDDEEHKYLRLSFAELYHVDDPAVKTIPKDEDALKLIHPSLRKIGAKPATTPARGRAAKEAATAATNGSGPVEQGQAASSPATEGSTSQPVAGDWGGIV